MAGATIKFRWGLSSSDPESTPVLIIGQAPHLNTLTYQELRCKLEPRVTEEAWKRGLACVTTSPGDATELWPRAVTLASLPSRSSRHAAPARAHALAKLVRDAPRSNSEAVVLVCRKCDVYASCLAVARSYPLFSARGATSVLAPLPKAPAEPQPRAVAVEILLVKEEQADGECETEGTDSYLADGCLSEEDLAAVTAAADAVRLAARVADTPANLMNVTQMVEEAHKVAKALDIEEPTVIRGEELRERGMGGLYGVGRGAADPPALVCLRWRPPGAAAAASVAWVGKGIVYDTGGLSIKARTSMVGMKGDCAGAAAVLGAFAAAVRAQPDVTLYAVLCVAENAVGPNSTRPDDVHRLYSGRTVEINNTDAEGRLVLADGVVYAARDLGASVIIDVATLTGAQGSATGKYHAAVLSNAAALEAAAVTAGRRSADLTFPVLFAPELHMPEYASRVADMKNSVADRSNAQVSCAGTFILAHLGFDFPGQWLHVDMASPAFCGERATGYGVALLTVLLGAHTRSRLLRALAPGPLVPPGPAH